MPVILSRAEARRLLVAHHGLARPVGRGRAGTRRVLERLRCIQLDPLDVIGTNADLVVLARTDGTTRGDVWRHLFPKHAFEHFAKERCILPASVFPRYRGQGHRAQTSWWRHGEREQRLPPKIVSRVLDEVRQRGPLTARDLTDHGAVIPIDWSGWKGTARATSMALELLWTRCEVVVCGRTDSGAKLYDVPERTFGTQEPPDDEPFESWALRERVRAAGLLTRAGGAMWSMLGKARTSPLVDRLIERGALVEVQIEDSSRRYLASPAFLTKRRTSFDGRVRILGPLDPLLWDRDLIRTAFGFDYVWEVYKPEQQRKWGWYVCPLLQEDRLIGRFEGRVEKGRLVVSKLWMESRDTPLEAVREAFERHAAACGAERVRLPRSVQR